MLRLAANLPSEDPGKVGRRVAARLRLAIPARIMTIYETRNCVLLDLSRTGARVGLSAPLQIGDGGYIMVGQLAVFGEVVRRVSGTGGGGVNRIAFEEPLAHAVVLDVRHHAETFERAARDALYDQVRQWVSGSI